MKPMMNTYRRLKDHKSGECDMCSEKVGKKPKRPKNKSEALEQANNYLLERNGHGY